GLYAFIPLYTMFEISRALSCTFMGYPRRREISLLSAFARFTRYSASLICPAIATAVASSSMKSLFTAFDPTKKPLLARLSAARTTPSEHVIPMVVVMGVFPGDPWRGGALLTRNGGSESREGRDLSRSSARDRTPARCAGTAHVPPSSRRGTARPRRGGHRSTGHRSEASRRSGSLRPRRARTG